MNKFNTFCFILMAVLSFMACDDDQDEVDESLSITLAVFYQDQVGNGQSDFINTSDANISKTVIVPRNTAFDITYTTSDGNGISETLLDYEFTVYNNDGTATNVTPLLTPNVLNGCPTNDFDSRSFSKEDKRKAFEFQAFAEDCNGDRNQTMVLTIEYE